ncbi:hypothetical protein [Streptomyces sp. NBC_01618]|uniref:hypothetical protein n=1 Tax=Streptomyces sp. NBC_01618 TaxID=2975900 RepID=UPI00386F71E5|nr:hypothetical protein OH735_04160 [Streptomyces sp. NBC_01618]
MKEGLADRLVGGGLCEVGESAEFDARFFHRQLEDKLRSTAAAADAGYPDNEGLVIDPETGIPSLKPHRSEGLTPSARRLEQEIKARMPERTLIGILSRTAYWLEGPDLLPAQQDHRVRAHRQWERDSSVHLAV